MKGPQTNIRSAGGMTLVEAVVATSIMAVVMTVVVPIVVGVRNAWAAGQSGAESVQNERILADHIYRHLITATAIAEIGPSTESAGYIQFKSSDGNTYRYQIGADNYVQFGPLDGLEDLAGPVSRLQFTGFSASDFTTPATDAALIRLIEAQATFPKTKLVGRDRTITTRAYLRVGAASGEDAASPFHPCIAAMSTIAWSGSDAVVDSYRVSDGGYDSASPGSEAAVSVNAVAPGSIALSSDAILRGSAYVGPGGDIATGIQTSGGAKITGAKRVLTTAVDFPVASAPTGPTFSGSHEGNFSLSGSAVKAINSDHYYNQMTLKGQSRIQISGDVTILLNNKLQVETSAQIEILPGSSLRLYVRGVVDILDSAKLNDTLRDPSRLRIYMIGNNQTMTLSTSAVVHAVLQNPTGVVNISGSAQFFGKIKAASLKGGGQIHVDLDCDFD